MSNLCPRNYIVHQTLQHIDDEEGEIAPAYLSAINVGVLKDLDDLEELCELQ